MDLSVIIPAYNEADAIGPVVEGLRRHLDQVESLRGRFEVLVVDDGSTDDTALQARAATR